MNHPETYPEPVVFLDNQTQAERIMDALNSAYADEQESAYDIRYHPGEGYVLARFDRLGSLIGYL